MTAPVYPSAVTCLTCGAAPGQPCTNTGSLLAPGRERGPHKARVRAAAGHVEGRHARRTLGHHPVNGAKLYGWTARCSCGWEKKVNGSKKEAHGYWCDHADGRGSKEVTP